MHHISRAKLGWIDIRSLNEPRPAKTCSRAYADCEGPDQPAHARSLIRVFTFRLQNIGCNVLKNVWMGNKGRVILCACAGCALCECSKALFRLMLPIWKVLLRYILLYSRKVLNNHCLTEIIWPMLYYGLENKLQLYKWIVLTRSAMNFRFVVHRFICKYSRRRGHGT